ncbi:isocitrate lyase/phosphoenolpyruvate mutase family protein, partial [Dehalococcoidia bacterium]|nr:isocitrate lyase/phosphoenolpyruvate mutase family protein [Dehalococcoidia bacterium]
VTREAMLEKIASAVAARNELLIIARTDARGVLGLEEAVVRAQLYKEAGADVIFPDGLESEAEFREFAQRVKGPLLANMTEFGKTPYISAGKFRELGYQIVIFPVTALRVAVRAAEGLLAELLETGTQEQWLNRMQTRDELYQLIGYDRYGELDQSVKRSSNS